MSKYTTEVRFICETYSGFTDSQEYPNVDLIISESRKKVFPSYPIFDEAYRKTLETKILKHFYTREIGFETVGLWKLKLATKLNEIMPYYNQLYKSQLLEFNPFYDTDLTTTNKGTRVGDTTNNLEETHSGTTKVDRGGADISNTVTHNEAVLDTKTNVISDDTNRYSDTPQGGLDGIESNQYLTNASINNGTSNTVVSGEPTNDGTNKTTTSYGSNSTQTDARTKLNTGTQNITTTDDYITHVMGKSASTSYSKMLQEFRKTFLNIDLQVINELNDLFLNLW